ncbi:hypothetical protein EVAR_97714_1 [Eumeta japonica]|uniref:Tetraspanin n=1 Tax=Eumeta variegata TaxID=151549 RepID=A0A4C1XZD2_EUMVA|nr:hypothetical protein EVAR_97714_1 [Eumeta japonica]
MVWHAQLVIMAGDHVARDGDAAGTRDANARTEVRGDKPKRKRFDCCECARNGLKLNERKILAVLILLLVTGCVTLIGLSVSGAIVIRSYSVGQSHRTAGLMLLGVTGALCLVLGIYAAVAPLEGERKALYLASILCRGTFDCNLIAVGLEISTALMILAMSQIALLCAVVIMTEESEIDIVRSLTLSFLMARAHSMSNIRLWATTQSDLGCCGLNDHRDYSSRGRRSPTEVPLPCCHAYDPTRSEILQSAVQKDCRAKGTYFKSGCKGPVLELFKETVDVISKVAICVIVLEVLTSVFGLLASRKSREASKERMAKKSTATNVIE